MFTCTSTAEKWQFFRRGFLQELDRVAPLRNIPVKRPFVVPLTCQTRQIIRQRQAALTSGSRHEYRTLNRLCKAAIRRESREFFQRELVKKGRGRLWQILKPVIGKKQTTSLLSNVTPDALNDYYVSVGPNTAASIPAPTAPVPTRLPRVTTSSFAVQPIDIHTLHGTLLNMKPSTTPGSCGFSMDMFTKFYSAIGFLLLDVINSSLVTGNVPTEWKRALITPIPKSKKTSGPADTRPITILPPPMKVVEKVVQNQLVEYLETNHLLSDSQHGYRRNHSTESALHVITDRVYRAMDCGEIGILVLLDLSKMFDVIPHETLLRKLHLYGVETRWFRNYITGHTQQVQMKTANGAVLKSSPKNNGIGIFQGGSLSCALCLLFTNDISLYVDDDVTVTQYADDTSVLITGKKSDLQHLVHRMEAILSSLFQWFCANGMKVNTAKTQMVVFGTHAMLRNFPAVSLKFGNATILDSKAVKSLGVTLDRHLNFEMHINSVQSKCTGLLIALSHVRHVVPTHLMPQLVQSLVLAVVRYCLCVYGSCNDTQMRKLQKIINFCARVVSGRRKFDHISDIVERLGWLNAKSLVQYHTACSLLKTLHTGAPAYVARTIGPPRNAVHNHATRRSAELSLPRIRTEAGRRRLCYRGASLLNELDIREAVPFKSTLRNVLLGKQRKKT